MQLHNHADMSEYMESQLQEAKLHFERTLECKHTEFDDLYPYMVEHPQFFWYKRYVAWSELLTVVKIANAIHLEWEPFFSEKQVEYITGRVLHGHILDHWFESDEKEEQTVQNHMEE